MNCERGGTVAAPLRRPHRPRTGRLRMTDVFDDGALAVIERRIDEWLAGFRAENPAIGFAHVIFDSSAGVRTVHRIDGITRLGDTVVC
mgnify:CR=1 FL=1